MALILGVLNGAAPKAGAAPPLPERINLTFDAPTYRLARAPDGSPDIQAQGYHLAAVPGQPLLPRRLIEVALPPDADLASLALELRDVQWSAPLPGVWRVRVAPPDQTNCAAVSGEAVPSAASLSPVVRIVASGQMRKWKLARLEFAPFGQDPATGRLRVVRHATVEVHFARRASVAYDPALLADSAVDGLAAATFVNFAQARAWYPAVERAAATSTDYVIVTTDAIEAASARLADFVAHKQARGHSVRVVTEDDYGALTGQAPHGRAEKVRQWLIEHYAVDGIRTVLLIGDPTPDGAGAAALPMKTVWPRLGAGIDEDSVTDYFFADLTGNWNPDGDAYYGEWEDYTAPGGVDLVAEVAVGRIPYYGDIAALDAVLQKTLDYETALDMGWQWSVLLPMGFQDSSYDGAALAEQMWDDYLGAAGFSRWRQYQQGSGPCWADSSYPSEQELRGGTLVRDLWAARTPGLVVWWGHGSASTTWVGYQGVLGCWDGTLFDSGHAAALDDAHPAFVFQNSCLNGYPEDAESLGYALLKHGAVTTVSASRVSWFNTGVGYGGFDGSTTNAGIAYEYAARLADGLPAGEALYQAMGSMAPELPTRLMNAYDFNLYGDPALVLEPVVAVNGVTLWGPRTVLAGQVWSYSAAAIPPDASPPVTYTWSSGELGPAISKGWPVTGTVTLAVTATGRYGQAQASMQITVLEAWPHHVCLPVVRQE